MANTPRSDLALEEHELGEKELLQSSGISCEEETEGKVRVTHIRVTTPEGAEALGKPMGNYITLEFPAPDEYDKEALETAAHLTARHILGIIPEGAMREVMVVGLGNRNITPDSIGPKVVERLLVTRHLFEHLPEVLVKEMRPLSAIAPGVLGLTGLETGEIVRGVADRTAPSLIIVVDALAARNVDRLSRTVQIADTGIIPGSGVGNHRQELSQKTLGIPVLAVGIPMVIEATSLVSDYLSSFGEKDRSQLSALLKEDHGKAFMVTPKEVDALSDRMAALVSGGINLAVHDGLSLAEIEAYLA